MNLLVHVEQYDVVGILPSQLESLALVCGAAGVNQRAFIDATDDGIPADWGFTRYGHIDDWMSDADPTQVVAFTPSEPAADFRTTAPQDDCWLVFGPSMGWGNIALPLTTEWVRIPGGTLNARDAVPIALWEMNEAWQGQ